MIIIHTFELQYRYLLHVINITVNTNSRPTKMPKKKLGKHAQRRVGTASILYGRKNKYLSCGLW